MTGAVMTDVDALLDGPITAAAALIKSRDVSPVELVNAQLGRIERLNGHLRAYTTVCADHARAAAVAAEREIRDGGYRGLLHGIPYAAKDLIYTKGVRTTCGSKILADWVPDEDATVITRLQDAGAILVGKLVMTEFAGIGYHPSVPPPRNPWNVNHWTGQSSSGSGVAAAAGMAMVTLGSDTGGSLRYPASACNVVGLRPTRGRVSRHGTYPLAETLDSIGPMARRADDTALVFAAIAGEDRHDPTSMRAPAPPVQTLPKDLPANLRLGMAENFFGPDTNAEVRDAVRAVATEFQAMGATLRPVHVPMIDEAVAAWGTAFVAECLAAHEDFFPARAADYSEALRRFLEAGVGVTGAQYAKTHNVRFGLRRQMDYIFDEVDVVLLPTMGCLPPSLQEFPADGIIPAERAGGLLRFTAPFALTGHPALSMPCGFSRSGLPMGAQLVGKFAAEPLLLRLAHAYQQRTVWHERRPDLGAFQ